MSKAFSRIGLYSEKLTKVLNRVDALVDWERRNRVRGSMRLMRVSAQPAQALLDRLNLQTQTFTAVHVTGSKGKGSVCRLIAAGLGEKHVGVLASPHVEKVNERIRISGIPIDDDALAEALTRALDAREISPVLNTTTWFDVVTVAALDEFTRQGVRYGIIEAGMGARRDSTAVVNARVGVITNIMYEHADIIGPTLDDIAKEKAGVVRPGASVVLGMAETAPIAEIFRAEARLHTPSPKLIYVPPPQGGIRAHNIALARAALKELGEGQLDDTTARNTLRQLPARQEEFQVNQVRVVLDGAHVPDSVDAVLQETGVQGFTAVIGVGADKDAAAICDVLRNSGLRKVIATSAGSESVYMNASILAETLRAAGFSSDQIETVPDAEDALNVALKIASNSVHRYEQQVVVVGSLHLAGRIRPILRQISTA